MDPISLLMPFFSGAAGGNLVGGLLKNFNLGSLGSNGGPTQTIPLLPGSVALLEKTRAATKQGLSELTEADLDKPTPESMHAYAATFGAMYVLLASHDVMHGGQFSVVRRKLGKPILF